MKKIDGHARTIRELLKGAKYSIDYYQREYKWQTKQTLELLHDLCEAFLDDHDPGHAREEVASYGHYFLGSIIVSVKHNQKFIIDGQQRLTTLTLLLIHMHNLQRGRPDAVKLDELIFSEKYSKKSFNLDVEERTPCMESLFNQQPFEAVDQHESVRNILGRYQDIVESFPDELRAQSLPYFVDWLIENVHLVEITAYSDEDAYTIFETMNDRGLSLTPADMLKGYLLANITDEQKKLAASKIWKSRAGALIELGKDEEADAIKTWLRSQHAQSIRERKKGAKPGDFDRLGTEFHRWVREHDDALGLIKGEDFVRFIGQDFNFYTRQYIRVREAAKELRPELECVFFNAQHEFTLQYPLLLAPLSPQDTDKVVLRKMRAVATFVDILVTRRLWNFRQISYSTMQYAMFLAMRDIRGKALPALVATLKAKLQAEKDTFASNDRLRLHQQNRHSVHQILARIADYLERESGMPSRFLEYVSLKGARHEIEHIWANRPERHISEFKNPSDFVEYRNRIGGLLLLPKSFNASYQDLAYEDKRKHYNAQSLLARSLHEAAYDHNPGFLAFVKKSGLPFKAHTEFKRADLDARQELYRRLAELVWDPSRLDRELDEL
ncbi:DUF262 domain-containing protein [Sorangium sp. So ce341]|uniref:DUF262 domain-containing protein n=1 Tax=Sorangium sp. So ce341 TaxID=3133302 RepID=UPI003F5FE486